MTKAPCKHPLPMPMGCRWCAMAVHKDRRYLSVWWPDVPSSEWPAAANTIVGDGPCVHRGGPTGERQLCPTCTGAVELKVLACAVKPGGCTLQTSLDSLPCCRFCGDRQPFPRPTVRNLLYHVYPVAGNGIWQWNVAELLKRIDLFNGRRVVAIVTDARADAADAVKDAFCGEIGEFIVLPNNPRLREVETFLPLFESVENTDPEQVTLYAHAKGVTRGKDHVTHPWTDLLYHLHLDYWSLVADQLSKQSLTGAFKKTGSAWVESKSQWHYSSSWFWVRNESLFGKDWRRIERFWTGIEPYPSLHFSAQEAGCLFHEGAVGRVNLYSTDYVRNVVLPQWELWKETHAAYRSDVGTLTAR